MELSQVLRRGELLIRDLLPPTTPLETSEEIARLWIEAVGDDLLALLNLLAVIDEVALRDDYWQLYGEVDLPVGERMVYLNIRFCQKPFSKELFVLFHGNDQVLAIARLWAAGSHRQSNADVIAMRLAALQHHFDHPEQRVGHPLLLPPDNGLTDGLEDLGQFLSA